MPSLSTRNLFSGKPPRFTKEQETELYHRMKAGDLDAKDQLAKSVLPWALQLVAKFNRRSKRLDTSDLEEVAIYATSLALNRWEVARGRLTTTIYWSVLSEFQIAVADISSPIKVPRYISDKVLIRASRKAISLNDETITARMQSAYRGLGSGRVTGSASCLVSDDFHSWRIDVRDEHPDPCEYAIAKEQCKILASRWQSFVAQLGHKDAIVAEERIRNRKRLGDVAVILDVTKESIRQREKRVRQKIAHAFREFYAEHVA
jgi:DNA-directed RNA polymerase sigma subunit (sigma70/sigma32)